MRGMRRILATLLLLLVSLPAAAQQVPTPEQFFGFKPGADGELARYPKVLEYFQLIAKSTDRVKFEEIGKTTMGNSYALVKISAPQNLAKLDRLVEINRRLADPRTLPEAEAQKLMHWMILAHVLMAGAFTWIYVRGVENKPWLGQGLRYGLAVAVLFVPIYMIYYVVQPTPGALAAKQIVLDTILTLVLGAVVAFLYRGQGR